MVKFVFMYASTKRYKEVTPLFILNSIIKVMKNTIKLVWEYILIYSGFRIMYRLVLAAIFFFKYRKALTSLAHDKAETILQRFV